MNHDAGNTDRSDTRHRLQQITQSGELSYTDLGNTIFFFLAGCSKTMSIPPVIRY